MRVPNSTNVIQRLKKPSPIWKHRLCLGQVRIFAQLGLGQESFLGSAGLPNTPTGLGTVEAKVPLELTSKTVLPHSFQRSWGHNHGKLDSIHWFFAPEHGYGMKNLSMRWSLMSSASPMTAHTRSPKSPARESWSLQRAGDGRRLAMDPVESHKVKVFSTLKNSCRYFAC